MSPPRFSVNNRVLVNMLMWLILIGGAASALTMTREMFPESRPNKLVITVIYPGTHPEEIEKAVTIKIEEKIGDTDGIERVDSVVSEGRCTIIITLLNEVKDVDSVLQEVKNDIDAIDDLPEDLELVKVDKLEPVLPVIAVSVFGDGDEAELKQAVRDMREDLLKIPEITRVELSGTRLDEISVEIRPERLLEYDITFDEVATAISRTNLDVSAGQLKGARNSISVRTMGEETEGVELEQIVIRGHQDGRRVVLADLAVVRDGFVERDMESFFNGKPAATCVVYKTKTQDAIQIATLVKAYVKGKLDHNKSHGDFDPFGFDLATKAPWYSKPSAYVGSSLAWLANKVDRRTNPATIYEESRNTGFEHRFDVALHTDLARFVEGRLDLMTRNGRTGLILVLVSLMLFLNWRVASWAGVGLCVSFFGTFIVMGLFGATFNLISLLGLIIVLGIIVDDAIVIGENIYRHIEEGMPAKEAAVKGAEEVMWPVIIAVLTTIAAFAPMFAVKGRIGDFLAELPVVVIAALGVSLIEALFILPVHLSELPSRDEMKRRAAKHQPGSILRFLQSLGRSRDAFVQGKLSRTYEIFLRFALRWRYVTMSIGLATLLIAVGLLKGGVIEMMFIQKMDSESIICDVDLPVGSTAEQVKVPLKLLSEKLVASPEVLNVQAFVAIQIDFGGEGAMGFTDQSHLGQLYIELKPADERERAGLRSSEELLAEFREMARTLAGVNSVTWKAMNGGPAGKDVEVRFSGDDFAEIVAVANQFKEELSEFGGVFDMEDNHEEGKREVRIKLRQTAESTGMTVAQLGNHVRAALYGTESRRITRNRETVKIMVRYPRRFREDVYNLESMWIPTSPILGQRHWVPLGQIAELNQTEGYTTIHRSQQQRAVTVMAAVDQEVANTSDIMKKIEKTFGPRLAKEHPGVRMELLGSFDEMNKAFKDLRIAIVAALMMIYLMLAGLFRSYVQPLVVMAAIPFGFQGAVIGHWITGNPFTFMSGIGMLALTGILVNDSLVLVDFINRRVREGMSHFEASIQGAKLRLRAILLTTLTTVAGLSPLMFETSFQAKFIIPMAITLTFGLIFATLLTLIIVPSLNMIFFDLKSLVGGSKNSDNDPPERIGQSVSV